MKKALLLLFISIKLGLYSQESGYSENCDKNCVLAFHSRGKTCYDEYYLDCGPTKSTVFGILRQGEIIGTDTSDEMGEFIIPIPDFRESDYYVFHVFSPRMVYSCMSSSYMDTLIWDNFPEDFKSKIYCTKHGIKGEKQMEFSALRKVEIKVFPNPASEFVTVSFDEPFSGKIRLLNMSGKRVLELPVELQKEIIVPLQNMTGLYYMQITDQRGVSKANLKLIVVH